MPFSMERARKSPFDRRINKEFENHYRVRV
jgi:hypothetical protein